MASRRFTPLPALATGLAAFAAAWAGIALTRETGGVASVWLANAVLVAALATAPRARWGGLVAAFVAGNAGANLAVGDAAWIALGFGAINALEAVVAATLMRRSCRDGPTFERAAEIVCYVGAAGVVAPLLAATLGAGFATAAFGASPLAVWPSWFIGDALGNLTLGPLLIVAIRAAQGGRARPTRRAALAALWPCALVATASLLVFGQSEQPLGFLLVPASLVASWRLGPSGAAMAVGIITAVGGVATALDTGPMALGEGSLATRIHVFQLLLASVFASTVPLAALLAERHAFEARLRAQATTDALTGLANRARFLDALGAAVADARRTGAPLSVAMLDVDHFKRVNDIHGHLAGDEALRRVARRLGGAVRGGDLCARVGGEEFAVLLPGLGSRAARALCERLRRAVEAETGSIPGLGPGLAERPPAPLITPSAPPSAAPAAPPVTISVGVAEAEAGEAIDALLSRADQALYAAKRAGRNRVALAA